jgi:hypothetical protein
MPCLVNVFMYASDLQARERSIKFPAMPPSVRAQVEPFVASDLSLWRHARALLYQRAYSGLLSPETCVPSRMLDNTINAQSCGRAVREFEHAQSLRTEIIFLYIVSHLDTKRG